MIDPGPAAELPQPLSALLSRALSNTRPMPTQPIPPNTPAMAMAAARELRRVRWLTTPAR
jgi:hypothetical protein